MFRIAFDLGRAAFVALHQYTRTDARKRHGGGKEQRLAGDQFFRLLGVGRDLFGRLAGAGRQSSQRQRRAHQLQEIAAPFGRILVLAPADRLPRKFALDQVLEFGRPRQFLQVAPEFAPASPIQPRPRRGNVQLFRCLAHR
jgi:hypothetical protein